MTASLSTNNPAAQQYALEITRVFDAPRALVFKVWTTREHQMHWMGPKDFTVPFCELDFRVGGNYRTCITAPDGSIYWMRGQYRDITEPERIVFTFAWEEEGERGLENVVTVLFEEHRGKTTMTLRQAPFISTEERDSHTGGWSECLERLAAYVAAAKA